jgi:hypothetical protein
MSCLIPRGDPVRRSDDSSRLWQHPSASLRVCGNDQPKLDEEPVIMDISEHVIFEHCAHPWTLLKLSERHPRPPKVDDGRVGINGKIGLMITTLVGTMICGYVLRSSR